MHQSADDVVFRRREFSTLSSSYPARNKPTTVMSNYLTSTTVGNGFLGKEDSLKSYAPTPEPVDFLSPEQLNEYKLQIIDLNSGQGLLIIDTLDSAMRIVYVNRGFERLTGWKSAEVLGSTMHFLQGSATNEKGVETIMIGLEQMRHVRVLLVSYRRNRTPFWNSIYTIPLPLQNGSKVHTQNFYQLKIVIQL